MKRILGLLLACLMLFGGLCLAEDASKDSGNWEMILLIGTDTREDEGAEGRADAIMVCALERDTGAIRLISLARDMWIQIPGRKSHNKINTAFRFGGAQMMMDAVNQTLDLDIEKYAAINFYGFCDVVDALGGVTVELEKGEASVINRTASSEYSDVPMNRIPSDAESATLTGAQALTYARIRELDNDFGRTGRQRKVFVAILEKVASLSILEQLEFIKLCLSCVETNVGLVEIFSLGTTVLAHGFDDMEQLVLPSQGNYHYDSADGTSKIIFDADAVREEAHQFIFGAE